MEITTQNIKEYDTFIKVLVEQTKAPEEVVRGVIRNISDAILTKTFEHQDPIKMLELKTEIYKNLLPLEKEAKKLQQQIDFFHYILKFMS
jgi:hypothetical protein